MEMGKIPPSSTLTFLLNLGLYQPTCMDIHLANIHQNTPRNLINCLHSVITRLSKSQNKDISKRNVLLNVQTRSKLQLVHKL